MSAEEKRNDPHAHDERRPVEEDAAAFREAMRGVRPIAPPAAARLPPSPARSRAPRARAAASADAAAADAPFVDSSVPPPERLSFRRPGVRDGQMRQLRRGTPRIEDEIDLHGLTQVQAHRLLVEFLDASRDRGLRCVRIIHGKGTRSGPRGAVLKAGVNEWLRRRHEVLAFTSARPGDGGGGAVYVLLRA
ncbi:MAG TPA: Smr/MutS family protein [Steroidobacteraceae bacterium]|nr:Smr/MutS family protein [Steroidobacteraceae bacterium]